MQPSCEAQQLTDLGMYRNGRVTGRVIDSGQIAGGGERSHPLIDLANGREGRLDGSSGLDRAVRRSFDRDQCSKAGPESAGRPVHWRASAQIVIL